MESTQTVVCDEIINAPNIVNLMADHDDGPSQILEMFQQAGVKDQVQGYDDPGSSVGGADD
jgi:hypothetical protein